MTFPTDELDVLVELQLGGTWTDVTEHVYLRDGIGITVGRADEGAQVDAGKCTLTFNNRDGRYSPRNPLSPHFGLLGRNTPIRVSAGAGVGTPTLYLPPDSAGFASTPDTAVLDITGDLDVRADVAADWGFDSGGLVGKYVEPTNQRSWILWLNTDRTVQFYWSSDGANLMSAQSTVPVPVTSGRLTVRATIDVDNGAAGRTVTFYTAATIAGPWTQLGDAVVQAGVTSIFASTSDLVVGRTLGTVSGRYYAAEVRNGIGGTVVANPDFAAQVEGAAGFTDGAGRVWSLAEDAAITTRVLRFTGEVSSWPSRWDVSGKDVFVPVEAAGILRRLGQGKKPLASALYREIASHTPYRAWWPLEDAAGATRGASGYPGQPPMELTGDAAFTGEPAGGVGGGLTVSDTGRAFGFVAGCPADWTVSFWLDLPADMTDKVSPIVQWRTPGATRAVDWSLYTGGAINGVLLLEAADSSNFIVISQGGSIDLRGRGPVQVLVSILDDGTDVTASVILQLPELVGDFNATSTNDTAAPVTSIGVNMWAQPGSQYAGTVSHIIVAEGIWPLDHGQAGAGYVGETAGDRFTRLCDEEGIPAALIGDPALTEPMGPQKPAPVLDLLTECEAADNATLHEARDRLALRYRTRATDYNPSPALTLDYTAGDIAPPIEPDDDDQLTRNDVTVSRVDGSSAQATAETGPLSVQPPPDGVGRYDESVNLNLESDAQLADQAGFRLHQGTWDEARYKTVHIDLAAQPALIPAVTAANLRSMARLTNLPDWLPPGDVDLFIEGYEETLGVYDWDVALHCRPAGPWRAGILDDADLGRLDTDGSQLAGAVDADDTAMLVTSTAGPPWTTDPAEAPFDVALGGEVVTVTAVGDGVTDGFDRTVANGWGSAPDGQAWTVIGTPSDFSVSGGEARMTFNATFATNVAALSQHCDPADVEVAFKSPVAAFTGSAGFLYLIAFYNQVETDWYALVLVLNTDSSMGIFVEKKTAGAATGLTAVTTVPGVTINNTSTYRARMRVQGGLILGKAWDAATSEPDGWHTAVFDSTHTGGGDVGVQVFVPAGVTNPLPLVFPFPELRVHNPQKFTVTRGTNGIVKAHSTGTDVRLAQPMILSF